MLTGEYGEWFYGEKTSFVGPDKVESSPLGASRTRYGIRISEQSRFGGGGWSIVGGTVARIVRPGRNIELFGKEIVRVHGVKETVSDQDFSYEFFLLVRPNPAGRGRLIKQWSFPREELGRTVPPALERNLRARYSGAELEKELETSKGIHVEGFLSLDEQSKMATITITGLVRPFQERVDLSQKLP